MKLTAELNLTNQGNQCQFGVEIELDDNADIDEIRDYGKAQIMTLWDEVKRFENPHKYYVDLSHKLWDIKQSLLMNRGKNNGR